MSPRRLSASSAGGGGGGGSTFCIDHVRFVGGRVFFFLRKRSEKISYIPWSSITMAEHEKPFSERVV